MFYSYEYLICTSVHEEIGATANVLVRVRKCIDPVISPPIYSYETTRYARCFSGSKVRRRGSHTRGLDFEGRR